MNRDLSDAIWQGLASKAAAAEGYAPTFNDLPMFLFALAVDIRRLADTFDIKIDIEQQQPIMTEEQYDEQG